LLDGPESRGIEFEVRNIAFLSKCANRRMEVANRIEHRRRSCPHVEYLKPLTRERQATDVEQRAQREPGASIPLQQMHPCVRIRHGLVPVDVIVAAG
jgi:hypothetical protein